MLRALFLFFLLLFSVSGLLAQPSHNVRLLCNWNDTTNAPVNGAGQHWNDVWGFSWKGREYAVIGGTNGAHVIDVDLCQQKAFLPGTTQMVIHRDFKTYSHYLYAIADEGFARMQVYDFSYLPDSLHLVWQSDPYEFSRAHGMFIDTAKARLYCASAEDLNGRHANIAAFSLANPEAPSLIKRINDYDNTSHLYVRSDTAWCSNGPSGMLILDMSGLPNTRIIGGLINYPEKGFNHSSWIGYDQFGVMTDESFGKQVKVIDARDPLLVQVRGMFSPRGADTTSIAHNPYLLGHYALVSYYQDGLQIYDVSDPDHPQRTGWYDTYPGPDIQTTAGAWGAYPFLPSGKILVSDMQTGLYVMDITDATPKLGVSSIPKNLTVSIAPNPANDVLSIRLPESVRGNATIEVYSSDGRLLLRITGEWPKSFPAQQVSLPAGMPAGLYLLRMQAGGQNFSARFIKR
jgi:choice-of-anchor B domain-containing protein